MRTLRECPEIGENSCEVLDSGHADLLAHRYAGPHGAMLFLHNLDEHRRTVHLGDQLSMYRRPVEAFADADYGQLDDVSDLNLNGWGYRWIRLQFVP